MRPIVDTGRMQALVDAPSWSPFNNAAGSLDISPLVYVLLCCRPRTRSTSQVPKTIKPYKILQDRLEMARVKKDRRLREKFRKRQTNLFKKANDLARMTESKIYIVV